REVGGAKRQHERWLAIDEGRGTGRFLEGGQQREARCDDSWLGVDGLPQRLLRSLEAERREREAHGRVGAREGGARGGGGAGDIRTHANRLAALAGKYEGNTLAHAILRPGVQANV